MKLLVYGEQYNSKVRSKAMRIPRKPRHINPELRKILAMKHARYMEMFGDDDWKKIDRKIQEYGNDYYRTDLFEDKATMQQASDNYETFRTGTPAMNAVAADMRQFYGLTPAVAEPVVKARLAPNVEATPEGLINITKTQGPNEPPVVESEIAAEIQRQEYVNDILGYDVQQRYEDINRRRGLFMDDADLELGLLIAAGLGSGALIGRASKKNDEDD